uniref:BHLH domain-containing protein n=1 Tax=Ciona savignyi TaxID=51511 RepID=H2ZP91_CIOSA
MSDCPAKKSRRKKGEGKSKGTRSKRASTACAARPNAAIRERERLKVFNDSLEALQKVIPVNLPEGRKLHKKQTLQLACRYIEFLKAVLDGERDWSERRRFWCGSDEDLNMIEAIDAAASENGITPKKMPKTGTEPHSDVAINGAHGKNDHHNTFIRCSTIPTVPHFPRTHITPLLPQLSEVYPVANRPRPVGRVSDVTMTQQTSVDDVRETMEWKQKKMVAIKRESTEGFPVTGRDEYDMWPDIIDIISKPEPRF